MCRRSDGRAALAAVASALLAAACGGAPDPGPGPGALRGSPLLAPVPLPDATLTDTRGEPWALRKRGPGRLTLLFFGYTHCPDVCPVHMATLAPAVRDLPPEVRDRTQVLFASTDPERDTPERLRSWLDGFDRSFVGLRGSAEQVAAVLAEVGLPGVAVTPSAHGGEPTLGHPAAVLAFEPDGVARVSYPFGTRRADWAHDLPLLAGPDGLRSPGLDPFPAAGTPPER